MDINTATFYDSLKTIPIFNFYECLDGNLKYMYHNLKGDITKEVKSAWNEMYNKYCELTFSSNTQTYYSLLGEITWLEKRLIFAPVLLEIVLNSKDKENAIKGLKNWKIFISLKKDLNSQIETTLNLLNNSKTKIKRKKEELKRLNDKQVKPISLSSLKVKIHRFLGIDVDTKKCSVIEWLEYWNEVEILNNKK